MNAILAAQSYVKQMKFELVIAKNLFFNKNAYVSVWLNCACR